MGLVPERRGSIWSSNQRTLLMSSPPNGFGPCSAKAGPIATLSTSTSTAR